MNTAVRRSLPIFLVAVNMRAGLILIGPLLPILKEEYNLSIFSESLLASGPLLLFSLSAIFMRRVNRLGNTNQIIFLAISVLTLSLILRITGGVVPLFIFSITLGISVAILNYMLPVWVKENNKENAGLVTGIYAAIMGTCASISLAITAPLASASSLSWRLSMFPWIAIGIISIIYWWLKMPKSSTPTVVESEGSFWSNPLFKNKTAWAITLFFGFLNMIHYASATWLPTILLTKDFTLNEASATVAIATLVGSLLSLAVPHYASRSQDLRGVLMAFSLLLALSYLAISIDSGWRLVIWVITANIGVYVTFSLALFLVIFRGADAEKTKSLSIMMQSIGYLLATTSPLILGFLFNVTDNWNTSLLFLVALSVLQVGIATTAGRREKI
ncbi:MAG: MFS transporter [Actinobacteria bacterium]|nr:MFS transporter [Actinomycetota bacterium]